MTSDPIITTERLTLRLVALDDADDIFEYCRNAEVARYTSWPAHRSIDDARQFVTFVLANHSDRTGSLRLAWAIRRHGDARVIGTVGLIQDDAETAHTDFALAQPFWNRGYMTEAVRAVVDWGRARLPALRRIRSGCLTENIGSRRVLEKAGFELILRESLPFGEKFGFQPLDVSRYEMRLPASGGRHEHQPPRLTRSR